ncbi:4-(cytidine 5'-diphospho)-2-C-methyl-D-erythritol kinase [Kordiimonas sp.]|uniref:4-(cytidine 5'-diphospho)-2-C-methyl-D-erythritol kinase n=1 Tax=Kordiimonas sp. TaxID=1970157 RepID=UPI003A9562CC
MVDSITVIAPAKVNLFLHITGRRDDGYHLLESLFAFTRQGDEITLKVAPELSLEITGPFSSKFTGNARDNLVFKAALALAQAAGIGAGAEITLKKNLPIAAGIGGGSADAAATLRGLNELWRLGLPFTELEAIAYGLGADVPACLYDTPQFVEGVGEKLTPLTLSWQAGIVLVNPGVMLSTPAVFKAFKEAGSHFDAPLACMEPWTSVLALTEHSQNSLERAAVSACAEVDEALQALKGLEGVQLARMSGSGATCFALFETKGVAEHVAQAIKNKHPGWWVMADELLTESTL